MQGPSLFRRDKRGSSGVAGLQISPGSIARGERAAK